MSKRSEMLAKRLERGAAALAEFASSLTDEEWSLPMTHDGRSIGVIVNHVASVYPVEIQLAQAIAAGNSISGLTGDDIDAMNAKHAAENSGARKEPTLELLRRNSAAAADAIREMSDADLDRATQVSLYYDATLTCQFLLEDHAVRHSYHHLGKIRRMLSETVLAA